MAIFYCIWCDLHNSGYENRDGAANTTPWIITLLQEAKATFDARTAKSQKTWKGVSADLLFDCIEPEDYIFSVLHDQTLKLALPTKTCKCSSSYTIIPLVASSIVLLVVLE